MVNLILSGFERVRLRGYQIVLPKLLSARKSCLVEYYVILILADEIYNEAYAAFGSVSRILDLLWRASQS